MAEERMVRKASAPQPKTPEGEVQKKAQKDFSVRLSLGGAPGIDEIKDSSGTYPAEEDGGARIEILATKRWWGKNNPNIGGMFGGGLFIGGHSGYDPDVPAFGTDLAVFGGMIQGGLAVKAGELFVFEVAPYIGFGIAENETTGFSSGTGTYGLFGIKGGAFVLLGESVELGLELGYEGFSHEQEFDFGGYTEDITFSGSGGHAALVLAVKF